MRILATSVDPWSESVGSDTLSSLLSQFDNSKVASINIRSRKSDSNVAGKYFHIIEDRVVRSIFKPSIKTGESYLVDSDERLTAEDEKENKRYSRKYLLGRWPLVIARELLWKLGYWKSKELGSFIQEFSPDVLFFPIEGYIHFNRINRYIIKTYHPKRIIGYMWDDNFTYKQHPFNPLFLIHRFWLKKSVKDLIERCDIVFAINPQMKKELDARYGIQSVLLTKPIREIGPFVKYEPSSPIRLLYTGKLIIGRDKTIADIVEAIQMVNKDKQRVLLEIYSPTQLTEKMRQRIDVPGTCVLNDPIPQSEVFKKQQEADVLLFVESLSGTDTAARLSFSTKITDYLSSGKCIWAIGSNKLAPIQYLCEEDAAVVSTSKEDIVKELYTLIDNPFLIQQYAQKAYTCGRLNHNQDMIYKRFREAICGNMNSTSLNCL